MASGERILVIKLGALGDFVLSTGPFKAIRAHHPSARITLLTIPSLAKLGEASGWFDEVWTDQRPSLLNLPGWLALARKLNGGKFSRVYDLQTSDRSGFYFRLMSPPFATRPEWSGIAKGASHPHANPNRDDLHTIERHKEQLAAAGIADVPPPDLSWAKADLSRFDLPASYALLVPGGSAHRPEKRWPATHYAELARRLVAIGTAPVLLGASAERAELATIAAACPGARDLCGQTNFAEIIALARSARFAVGNDTGPMHLVAAAGCPTVSLFSYASDPALCAPRSPAGESVVVLRRTDLATLMPDEVLAALPATI
ncbi:MAG: glycosyltransferase family 9 protein [Alphaproteobacteria bacterium]